MATQPGAGTVAGSSPAAPKKSPFWSCFSCRVLTASGMAGAGLWVQMGIRQKRPGNPFDIFRLVFAIGLYSCAIIIAVDPVQVK